MKLKTANVSTSSPAIASIKRPNGRPRKNLGQKLPKRVYLRGRSFYYVHAASKRWENLGSDLSKAAIVADSYNANKSTAGTMNYWFDQWLKELASQVRAGALAERTEEDYTKNVIFLREFFGDMHPSLVNTADVQAYLVIGRDEDRPIRANREVAALSSCFRWMKSLNKGGVKNNPCKGVIKNSEESRTRYVTDAEYRKVHSKSSAVLRAWAETIYRTLQRPSDVLTWTRSKNIIEEDGIVYLTFRQSKTGAPVKIIVAPMLEEIFERLRVERERQKVKSDFLFPTENGKQYTRSGITSIWSRATKEAGVVDFGVYDAKSKGATDMYLAGTPLETIQFLCAHDSVRTTERYVKSRIVRAVEINTRDLGLNHAPREPKVKSKP